MSTGQMIVVCSRTEVRTDMVNTSVINIMLKNTFFIDNILVTLAQYNTMQVHN